MSNPLIEPKYLHSVCRIRSMENIILTMGRIEEIGPDYVLIQNEPELLAIIQFNKQVRLSILNDKLGFLTLIATVYTSTAKALKLVDIKEVNQFEKRSYYRLGVDLNGIITFPVEKEAEDPSVCESHKVIIENVSLSGVLFSSSFPLQMRDRLSITISAPFGKLDFVCIIRRIVREEESTSIRYGCEFEKYPERSGDALWKYMMLKEREDIRKARGEWSNRG